MIVGVRVAVAIKMNWRPSKSKTPGTYNSTQNGMEWLRIDLDMFLFLPQRLTQYLLLESSQQPLPLHTDVFEDSHGGKVTTAPLHHLHKRHVLRFLPPIVCLSSSTLVSSTACWKPSAPTFRKRQSRHKGSSGLSASAVENCLSFLLYNAFRCRNGRCGWCAGRNDRSIRVEISGLLAKVLTSAGWLRSVWNSKSFEHKESIQIKSKSRLHCSKCLCQWKIVKIWRQGESSELKQTSNIWLKGRISMRTMKW